MAARRSTHTATVTSLQARDRPVRIPSAALAGPAEVTISTLKRECESLVALDRLDALATPRNEAFDRITQLAKRLFNVPIAIVSFTAFPDKGRQEAEALDEGSRKRPTRRRARGNPRPVVVNDTTTDRRFAQNPFVTSQEGVRFYVGMPLTTSDGRNVGSLCLVDVQPREFGPHDMTLLSELARLIVDELELRLSATRDVLTGALSRRGFEQDATRTMALALRHDHDLGCIGIDIDHFKSVNDTYGHAAGDHVLASVVRACMAELRATDSIGRMGGEEFAVLLPNTGLTGATDVARRLRTTIANLPIVAGSQTIRVTASFGVAARDSTTTDIEEILNRADDALYRAKTSGRNRCVVWRRRAA